MKRIISELYVRDNCHPFKATVLVWIQLPMWIFMSFALRNLSTGAAHSEGNYYISLPKKFFNIVFVLKKKKKKAYFSQLGYVQYLPYKSIEFKVLSVNRLC